MEAQPSRVTKSQFKQSIVCMSSTHWHFLWQRPQQIMSRLSRYYQVLFVDPPGMLEETENFKAWGEGRNMHPRLHSISGSLKVLSPFQRAEPSACETDLPGRRAENTLLIQHQIHNALRQLQWNHPFLLWIYHPQAVCFIGTLGESKVIYDCVDHFSSFSWSDPRTKAWEEELGRKADLIFTSANALYHTWKDCGKPLFLIPNAADFEHFSKKSHYQTGEPPDLREIKAPRIGFVGAVYEWLDLELLRKIAAAHPEWNLVMIGPQQHGLTLPVMPNLHWLGSRDYKVLPWYIQHLDIMLIPFLQNTTTEHANPIKFWEYLAAGKQVVTTLLPEIPQIPEVTWVSEDDRQFEKNCVKALSMVHNPAQRLQLALRAQRFAQSNSWEERCRRILMIMKEHFQ